MDAAKDTIPEISRLKGYDDLENWKREVREVLEFNGWRDFTTESVSRRKRPYLDPEDTAFLLGLLSASVTHVAHRLIKAGWDFRDRTQDPCDLYGIVLKVIVSPSKAPEMVSDAIYTFSATTPLYPGNFGKYRKTIEDQKTLLDAIGCPMDDNMAICIVVHALRINHQELHQQLLEDMSNNELTWSKLLDKLSTQAANQAANQAAGHQGRYVRGRGGRLARVVDSDSDRSD